MASTRFSNDECRITKKLQESTGLGKYMLNVPGPNTRYLDDPHIRMQKYGGNLHNNFFMIERELQKPSDNLKDCLNFKKSNVVSSKKFSTTIDDEITSQSRATHPVWNYRNIEYNNSNYLFENPQDNAIIPFEVNSSSRILDKDNFLIKE